MQIFYIFFITFLNSFLILLWTYIPTRFSLNFGVITGEFSINFIKYQKVKSATFRMSSRSWVHPKMTTSKWGPDVWLIGVFHIIDFIRPCVI